MPINLINTFMWLVLICVVIKMVLDIMLVEYRARAKWIQERDRVKQRSARQRRELHRLNKQIEWLLKGTPTISALDADHNPKGQVH